jgi:lipopolysaccharide biosynthesis glycosyltransferase
LPLDEVAYVDVDVILFRDFSPIFGRLEEGKTEFVVASPSFEYVYNDNRSKYPFLNDALLFNDGFWVTSNRFLKLSDFIETMEKDAAIFHDVRKRGQLFAQPLVNFVVHRRGLKITLLPHCVENASHESFYKAPGITFEDGKPLDPDGKEIYFAHWAGATALPSRGVFDPAWTEYSKAAWARFKK